MKHPAKNFWNWYNTWTSSVDTQSINVMRERERERGVICIEYMSTWQDGMYHVRWTAVYGNDLDTLSELIICVKEI
jgi:hypothetical protein